jgi:hypothetical protein
MSEVVTDEVLMKENALQEGRGGMSQRVRNSVLPESMITEMSGSI